jgi:hypothetical protein
MPTIAGGVQPWRAKELGPQLGRIGAGFDDNDKADLGISGSTHSCTRSHLEWSSAGEVRPECTEYVMSSLQKPEGVCIESSLLTAPVRPSD